jgi:hypothetical protein
VKPDHTAQHFHVARACGLRVGIPATWPRARSWITRTKMTRLPPAAHPHPHAGGRGDGPRAEGAGTGGGIGIREARYGHPTPPTSAIR